ncbi:MAG: type II secretion system F family protein [Proteobacteria bacterium]|nr:type II secretion system F family protein [Pseudomonadota bacterium]MBU1708995.1 type II secretion system F family protein [Pseudomonadota bacterium]
MGLFSYTALDSENTLKEGVFEDVDKEAVAKRLIMQGLRPLEIQRHRGRRKSFISLDKFRKEKITSTDIEFFTNQISLLLNAGLSLDGSLRIMKHHSNKLVFKDFAGQIERKLKEGKSFSQALADYPKYFSPMYINIAKAGEEGGILPAMLTEISEYQSTFQELKQFIISASIYPIILLLVGSISIVILLTTILPRFEILFEGVGRQLPFHVQILMSVAKFISSNMLISLGIALSPIIGAVLFIKSKGGKIALDRFSIRLPLLSGFVKALETTRIFRTIQVLVENGVHLSTALKISSGVAGNLEFQRLLKRATEALKEGRQVGQKLKSEGLFPELAADLLSIGEESGQVGQVCGQIADHYEKDLRNKIKRIIALIEPLFILVIAVIAGYVVISMLSVILSINDIAG